MKARSAALGLALALLPFLGAPAFADDAFTLDCRVTQTEKIDSGSPTSRAHAFVASIDLNARKFHVFEDTSRKFRPGRTQPIRSVEADVAHLTAASEFRHGTERAKRSGVSLDLRTLALAATDVLGDGSSTIETTWTGACRKAPFRPLPPD